MGDSRDKKMCKLLKKDHIEDDFEFVRSLVRDPKFICKKCGRVANEENRICKPKSLG